MRVLILSANTGGGHNSTARALSEQLEKHGFEYEIADTLSFISEKISELVSRGHNYVYRNLPQLFGQAYRYEENHPARFLYTQCARGADSLYEHLSAHSYDAVICVHVFSGMMMTEVRRRHGCLIPCFFIATDYTCSPGVSEMDIDGYFIPHRMLFSEFVRSNLPVDRLFATGIPIRGVFYEAEEKLEARKKLNLPLDGRMILLGCGSMGAGKMDKIALKFASRLGEKDFLVVLCGSNKKTFERLSPFSSSHLFVVGFTDLIPDYMSASDLYVTKPGGLTTTEAIARRTPMIFIDAVPGCESRNFRFLIRMGIAKGTKRWRHVYSLTREALSDPRILQTQVEKMKEFQSNNSAETIVRLLMKNVNVNTKV